MSPRGRKQGVKWRTWPSGRMAEGFWSRSGGGLRVLGNMRFPVRNMDPVIHVFSGSKRRRRGSGVRRAPARDWKTETRFGSCASEVQRCGWDGTTGRHTSIPWDSRRMCRMCITPASALRSPKGGSLPTLYSSLTPLKRCPRKRWYHLSTRLELSGGSRIAQEAEGTRKA